ncbi:unnamed protein product, partial [marine sediment metagenome]
SSPQSAALKGAHISHQTIQRSLEQLRRIKGL